MAKQDRKKSSKIKVKKKIWYKVMAAKSFGQKHLGDIYLTSPELAVGRSLKANLRDLTGSVRDQNAFVKFQISKVDGTTLHTSVIGYELVTAFVKRLVRKNSDRIDVHTEISTKDGKKAIAKSILLTLNKTYRSTRTELQQQYAELLKAEAEKVDFATFVSNLTSYKVQSSIKKRLAKTYPMKETAVRMLNLQKAKGSRNIVVEEHPEAHQEPVEQQEVAEQVEQEEQ